jgi:hypothetical protein
VRSTWYARRDFSKTLAGENVPLRVFAVLICGVGCMSPRH